jgi:hypothetical protein
MRHLKTRPFASFGISSSVKYIPDPLTEDIGIDV